MSDIEWSEVVVPQGTFVGWGKVGQTIIGRTVAYGDEDGRDYDGEPCPQIVVELVEQAHTFRSKDQSWETIEAGELATITGGQASLARALRAASPEPGRMVRIVYAEDYKTSKGSPGKGFRIDLGPRQAPAPPVADDPFTTDPF